VPRIFALVYVQSAHLVPERPGCLERVEDAALPELAKPGVQLERFLPRAVEVCQLRPVQAMPIEHLLQPGLRGGLVGLLCGD
jgi:hypothetical protein